MEQLTVTTHRKRAVRKTVLLGGATLPPLLITTKGGVKHLDDAGGEIGPLLTQPGQRNGAAAPEAQPDCPAEDAVHKTGRPTAKQVWHVALPLLYSVLSLSILGWADEDSGSFL